MLKNTERNAQIEQIENANLDISYTKITSQNSNKDLSPDYSMSPSQTPPPEKPKPRKKDHQEKKKMWNLFSKRSENTMAPETQTLQENTYKRKNTQATLKPPLQSIIPENTERYKTNNDPIPQAPATVTQETQELLERVIRIKILADPEKVGKKLEERYKQEQAVLRAQELCRQTTKPQPKQQEQPLSPETLLKYEPFKYNAFDLVEVLALDFLNIEVKPSQAKAITDHYQPTWFDELVATFQKCQGKARGLGLVVTELQKQGIIPAKEGVTMVRGGVSR